MPEMATHLAFFPPFSTNNSRCYLGFATASVDFLFTTANGTPEQVNGLNKYFEKYFDSQTRVIQSHLEKADIVPLDMRYLESRNQNLLLNHVKGLPVQQQRQIFLMW